MLYMKDAVNTEENDQQRADQTCDHESAAASDERCVKNIFQNDTPKIHNCNDHQNVKKSSQEIVSDVF